MSLQPKRILWVEQFSTGVESMLLDHFYAIGMDACHLFAGDTHVAMRILIRYNIDAVVYDVTGSTVFMHDFIDALKQRKESAFLCVLDRGHGSSDKSSDVPIFRSDDDLHEALRKQLNLKAPVVA